VHSVCYQFVVSDIDLAGSVQLTMIVVLEALTIFMRQTDI